MKTQKKWMRELVLAFICICAVFFFRGETVSAAMADEAEDYELGETYTCTVNAYTGARYYKIDITGKSHVSLNISMYGSAVDEYTLDSHYINIYKSNGKKVLNGDDLQYKENAATGKWKAAQYRVLSKGTYYLEISSSMGGDSHVSFCIDAEPQIKLAKGVVSSVKSSKKGQITVKCKSAKNAIGYQIQYSTDYRFKKGVKKVNSPTLSRTMKGLKKGTRYYVRVRPYTVYGDGTVVYGQYSYVKTVKVKK